MNNHQGSPNKIMRELIKLEITNIEYTIKMDKFMRENLIILDDMDME